MPRKKSIEDLQAQLRRIRGMAESVYQQEAAAGQRTWNDRLRNTSRREDRAINAFYKYRDNIERSKAFDNSARRIAAKDPWALMAGANEKVKFSQRTYMGLSAG